MRRGCQDYQEKETTVEFDICLEYLGLEKNFFLSKLFLGRESSIPLLNVHLKNSISSPESRVFLVFSPTFQYKSQTNPSLEYCSHVWGGAPKYALCVLDKVQSKAIRLINNPNLTKSLQPSSHRRLFGYLSIFYRYFHRHCSQEIGDIIPVPLKGVRTTRSSTHSHPFQVSLPNPRTLSHKSSFIPRTCNLWNFLPSSCFPESHNLPSFKSKINKLDLISLSFLPLAFLFLPSLLGLCIGHHGRSPT